MNDSPRLQAGNSAARQVDGTADFSDRICPICGGRVIDIHCVAQCLSCHTMIDTCCEGVASIFLPPIDSSNAVSHNSEC